MSNTTPEDLNALYEPEVIVLPTVFSAVIKTGLALVKKSNCSLTQGLGAGQVID